MHRKTLPIDAKSIHRLSTNGLAREHLVRQLGDNFSQTLEIWRAQGLDIVKEFGHYYFSTKFTKIQDATFCIVDIETNGSKIDKHQIIEIAAVKVKNGEIIDRYESLVYTKEINPHITQITGISAEDTKNAPALKDVLYKFKEFLGDSIFIAHDVKFDYKFISASLEKIGLEPLLNRALCSLDLAQRTVESYRYALSYLNDTFHFNKEATHHRAMSDVVTTYGLFKLSMSKLNEEIIYVEDLITFSKEAKMLKRPKFDPLQEKEK